MANRSSEGSEDTSTDIIKLGEQLRALREAQGLTYEDVASATRVRPHLLQAIEEGTIDDIAAPVYARGFVKTYCEYLYADDLWRKYLRRVPPSDLVQPSNDVARDSSVDINHPTPMFRRSSIIWVYVILVIAVLGAAFLLWSQQRDHGGQDSGFFLRMQERERVGSPDEAASTDVPSVTSGVNPPPSSMDIPGLNTSRTAVTASGDNLSVYGAAVNNEDVMSLDLSWMGGEITSLSGEPRVSPASRVVARQELLIEIKGRKNRLVVNQGGRNVTTRDLTDGDSRTYYVTTDTQVSLGVGSAADLTWYGQRYEGAGSDENPVSFIFYPDGRVKTTSGNSSHFGAGDRTSR
jgi:cytoskeletal protein RodZ